MSRLSSRTPSRSVLTSMYTLPEASTAEYLYHACCLPRSFVMICRLSSERSLEGLPGSRASLLGPVREPTSTCRDRRRCSLASILGDERGSTLSEARFGRAAVAVVWKDGKTAGTVLTAIGTVAEKGGCG